jgi:Fe-S cluster assembly protein SufD
VSTTTDRPVAAPTATPAEVALPTRRDEAWRYAPHGTLARLTFGPAGQRPAVPEDLAARLPALDGPLVVVVNGSLDGDRSRLEHLPAGVTIEERQGPDGAGADRAADAFALLNTLHAPSVLVVRVEAGRSVEAPVHLVDVAAPGSEANTSSTRVVIEVGDGASATVVESHVGAVAAFGGSNVRTTVSLGAGAALEHVVLQDLAESQVLLERIEVTQAAGSVLRARSFNLGAAYGRIAYHVDLDGEEAIAELSGLYFGSGSQVLDQQVNVVHRVGNCTSRQAFRGVLDGRSTGVFNGGVEVLPGADGTDAAQSNDNLLLSRHAEVDTQPRLEILADDVSCSHGATVGQLDEMALYYLRSRGIPSEEASRLLIDGFADQTVDDVSHPAVRAWIAERLGHRHE